MKPYLIAALCLACYSSPAQILNPDFEQWYTDTLGQNRLYDWDHLAKYDLSTPLLFATWRDSQSQQHLYALKLSRWYNYTWDVARQKAGISSKPAALEGYYRYTDAVLYPQGYVDTGLAEIYLTRWNAAVNQPDTVAHGRAWLTLSSSYSHFSCPIGYFSALQPDSLTIRIEPSKFAGQGTECADSNYCSFLTIDNLSLTGTVSVDELAAPPLAVYPNPAANFITVHYPYPARGRMVVRNMMGMTVWKGVATGHTTQVDVSALAPGFYQVQVTDDLGRSMAGSFLRK